MQGNKGTWRSFFVLGVIFSTVWGCGGGVTAPTTPDGSKITLLLYTDTGIKEGMAESLKADQGKLAAWMESDLDRQFVAGGYLADKIGSPKDFKPSDKVHMVVLTIESYRSEDMYMPEKETRLGDGITRIQATAELFKDNHTLPVLRVTDEAVTSRDWTVGAGELTAKLAAAVSSRISELY